MPTTSAQVAATASTTSAQVAATVPTTTVYTTAPSTVPTTTTTATTTLLPTTTTVPTTTTAPTTSPAQAAAPTSAPPSSGCGGEAPVKSDGGQWQCSWSDEFNSGSLSSAWGVIPYGLGSACLYDDPSYVSVSGGMLNLSARKLAVSDPCTTKWGLQYGGAGIQTNGFAQAFGRFEIRAKLPAAAGTWPAFWLSPSDQTFDGEIDILETYGGRGSNGDATLHVPAGGPGPQTRCTISPDYATSFHTYAMEWAPGSIKIYYDNTLCVNFTSVASGKSGLPSTFDKKYQILLDLAVQPWYPPNGSGIPSTMQVDYLRVWR